VPVRSWRDVLISRERGGSHGRPDHGPCRLRPAAMAMAKTIQKQGGSGARVAQRSPDRAIADDQS
jgi:hypothetical protein